MKETKYERNDVLFDLEQNAICCSSHEFLKVLKKERAKIKIDESPATYIVFNFTKYFNRLEKHVDREAFIAESFTVISNCTKDYRMYYFLTSTKIRLLLQDVQQFEAEMMLERIMIKLFEYLKFQSIDVFLDLIKSMAISCQHLSPYTRRGQKKSSRDWDANFKADIIAGYEENLLNDEDIPGIYVRWDENVSAGSVRTLTTPIFWDVVNEKTISLGYKFVKRCFDIFFSLLFIFLFSPMIFLIGLAVKLTSRGPVFFKQERLGYWGKSFMFYKFRTMFVDNDTSVHEDYVKKLIAGKHEDINYGTEEKPMYKLIDDPRITPLGRILRLTSLDEIPQFFNVLKGDMSLIGPRPPIPYEVSAYQKWHFKRLFQVKPGITGLWQVSGRNNTTFDDMVKLDIQYANNMSLMYDLKILFKTFGAVLALEGN